MGYIERLFDNNLPEKDFRTYMYMAYVEITQRPITQQTKILLNRLLKMYGRKGVISSLITLDTAIASGKFTLGNNIYPFLVYGAKKAFEDIDASSIDLTKVIKTLQRRRGHK